jgi:hypothetical protein
VATTTVIYVNLDPVARRSRPLPLTVRERMNAHIPKESITDGKP